MRHLFTSLEEARFPKEKNVHLAIGMFDGVHRGHQRVLSAAKKRALADGGLVAALTFTPHPSRVLRPDKPSELLVYPWEKIDLLFKYGADAVIEQPFNETVRNLEAKDFPELLKRQIPNLKSIHIGENFRFGKGRGGSSRSLAQCAQPLGVDVEISPSITHGDEPVSSTRIRALLRCGRMHEANELMGRLYETCGTVIKGKQLGRTIGFPTLNFVRDTETKPAYGVYLVTVHDPQTGVELPGVANYGLRPTVEKKAPQPILEVHVLSENCPWGPGDVLCVRGHKFLRAEQKFPLLAALRQQIEKDKAQAIAFFTKRAKRLAQTYPKKRS